MESRCSYLMFRSGSIWARLRVVMANEQVRKRVAEVVETAADGLSPRSLIRISRPLIVIVRKRRSLKKKLKICVQCGKESTEATKRTKSRSLDIERLQLENQAKRVAVERQKLENAMLQLQVVEKAADLLRKGLLRSAPMTVNINGMSFITIEQDHSEKMNEIGVITEAEIVDVGNREMTRRSNSSHAPRGSKRLAAGAGARLISPKRGLLSLLT